MKNITLTSIYSRCCANEFISFTFATHQFSYLGYAFITTTIIQTYRQCLSNPATYFIVSLELLVRRAIMSRERRAEERERPVELMLAEMCELCKTGTVNTVVLYIIVSL